MTKQIFSEEIISNKPTLYPKQEFSEAEVVIEPDEPKEAEFIIEQSLKTSRVWIRVLLGALVLFGVATIAQSVQWLIDTFQTKEWIAFAFSIAFFLVSLTGIGVIIREWQRLVYLRKHEQYKQTSEQLLLDELNHTSGQNAVNFCKKVLTKMPALPSLTQAQHRWESQLNEAYNAKEVLYLFSENVLTPLDKQVKTLISKHATENAIIVAISPLATVDILMTAWRNFSLVNKISRIYGMELGYFSRLKLFKMVLTNMVFAGATEIATDVGMDFFSQNITARLSLRAAQGIGVGLLTARLGLKAMEFCRPVVFQANEKPTLSAIRQELLSTMKNTIFAKTEQKEPEKVK